MSSFGVSVPSSTVPTSVSSVPSVSVGSLVCQLPLVPTVPPIPLVPSTVSIPSAYSNPSLNGGVSQVVYRPIGPGANDIAVRGSEILVIQVKVYQGTMFLIRQVIWDLGCGARVVLYL